MQKRQVVMLLFALSVGPLGGAATGAELSGKVLDAQGQPLPGATVALIQQGEPVQTTWADANGAFAFTSVAAGAYQLRASLDGFGEVTTPVELKETGK
jgi:uncharacterized GH25 family protein